MNDIEEKNAVITDASINIQQGFLLDAWIYLEYKDGGQGFGGYVLYTSSGNQPGNYCGLFLYRVMEIAGVEKWDDLKGKTIRVRANHSGVKEIGHIIKDDWFNPKEEFKKLGALV